jgi:hypothetical protein
MSFVRYYFTLPGHLDGRRRRGRRRAGVLGSTLALLEDGATHVGVATDHVIGGRYNDVAGLQDERGSTRRWPSSAAEGSARGDGVGDGRRSGRRSPAAARTGRGQAHRNAGVVICTPDKDLAQCVTDPRVVQLDRRQRRLFDEAAVREKFGVSPESIPDWLALVGDNADGFPGLPGWGAKSAASVLARYGHLEEIPVDPSAWDVPVRGAAKLATTLGGGQKEVMLFRDLAPCAAQVGAVTTGVGRPVEPRSSPTDSARPSTPRRKAAEGESREHRPRAHPRRRHASDPRSTRRLNAMSREPSTCTTPSTLSARTDCGS